MTMCGGARLALLVFGIIMHGGVRCSPDTTGPPFSGIRSDYDEYEYEGNAVQNVSDLEPPGVGSPASAPGEDEVLRDQGEIRDVANVILRKAYRKVLDVLHLLSGKSLLQKLVAKSVGGIPGRDTKEDSYPPSKRHSDGIFADSYRQHLNKKAVREYLVSVLGNREKKGIKTSKQHTCSDELPATLCIQP